MIQGVLAGELARTAIRSLSNIGVLKMVRPASGMLIGPSLALVGAGIAIGTGIGLFLAPRSGRDMQKAVWGAMSQGIDKIMGKHGAKEEGKPLDPHSTRRNGESAAHRPS